MESPPIVESPPPSSASETDKTRAFWRKLLGFVALSVGFAVLGAVSPLRSVLNSEDGVDWVRQLGVWGPLAMLMVGMISPFAFLPRWPLAVACGILYGVGWGGVLANVASTLGAWLQFLVARRVLNPATERILARYGRKIVGLPPKKAFALLLTLRLFPLSNFVVTNLLAASLKLSTGAYVLGTFVGMVPSTLMYGAWGRMAVHPQPSSYVAAAILCLLVGVVAWIAKGRLGSRGRSTSATLPDR